MGAADARRQTVQGLVLTAQPTQGVAPLLVRFYLTVPVGPPPNLSWSFGDGRYLNGTAPSDDAPAHTYDSAGTFRCIVTAEWSTGSVNTSLMILVRPINLSVAVVATPSNGTYPLTVWLNATVHGGTGTYVSFYWSFGDGNQGSGLSVQYTYSSSGRFLATFTATDTRGGNASASTTIRVVAPVSPGGHDTGSGSSALSPLTIELVVLALTLGGIGAAALYLWTRRFPIAPSPHPDPPDLPMAISLAGPATATPESAATDPIPAPSPPAGALHGGPNKSMSIGSTAGNSDPRPPVLSTPSRITDALLRHLSTLPKLYPGDLPNRSWTQGGIAESIGAGQSAVSRVLRRLVAAGIVTVETRHVAGSPRRVRIYRLTERGERLGRALREAPGPRNSPPMD
ncbi:MAG: PKD domain-containing protein [Thermoplasmata archaeon]|nr:PKD domain-containing protein [Thermoplasmata archaeon]